MKCRHFIALAALCCFGATPAWATSVNLVGLFGDKALASVDGGEPRMYVIGQRDAAGVMLIAVGKQRATFEIDGKSRTVAMGQHYATPGPDSGARTALHADARGHFVTQGAINGAAVIFLVDTGATSVAFSTGEAKRMGVDYFNAPRGRVATANGSVTAYKVQLDTVRVGSITLNNVEAMVLDSPMSHALLGMSFLNRMQMERDGATMTLTRRY